LQFAILICFCVCNSHSAMQYVFWQNNMHYCVISNIHFGEISCILAYFPVRKKSICFMRKDIQGNLRARRLSDLQMIRPKKIRPV